LDTRQIVITGGPGTGKSSIIRELKERGYTCFEEISRQITLEARKEGVEQLFLTDPLLFSERLLEGRIQQHREAKTHDSSLVFLDRGIPDVLAYMEYSGDDYPDHFEETAMLHNYDHVFILAPWEEIYVGDNVRYESFDQAIKIHEALLETYKRFGYSLLDVPFDSISNRADFILNNI